VAQPIVGREMELARLERFLLGLHDGPRSLMLIGNEGIGKTTLWKEGLAIALQRGARVLACRSAAPEVTLSFTALADLFDKVYDEVAPELPGPQRSALGAALLREGPSEPDADQRAVARAVLAAIRHFAATSPVVLAMDDAQWLDAASGRVLRFALRRLEDEPLGLLLSTRSDALEEAAEAGQELHACFASERAELIEVGPPSLDALDQIIRSRLGSGLLHPTLVQVHRASGGNPMFALEMARALVGRTTPFLPGEVIPAPESLRSLVRDRLSALPADVTQVLRVISALRRPTVELVRAGASESDVASMALRVALEAGVVELEGEAIQFTHPLLASVVYGEASREERRNLHRRLGAAVADPEERARHLALGADGPDPVVAASLDAAALQARRRGAPDAAAELGELARRLTPPDQKEDAVRRSINAAENYAIAGDAAHAYRLVRERARALVDLVERNWPDSHGRAPLAGQNEAILWDEGGWERTAADLFGWAKDRNPDDADLQAACGRGLMWTELGRGNLGQAAAHARAALGFAEQLDDRSIEAETLTAIALIELSQSGGMVTDVMARATALQLGDEATPAILRPSWMLAVLLKWTDQLEEARSRFEALRELALERGDWGSLPGLMFHLSEVEWRVGDWQAARRSAAEGQSIALRVGDEALAAALRSMESLVDANTGAFDLAEGGTEAGTTAPGAAGGIGGTLSGWALGLAALARDRPGDAVRFLAACTSETTSGGTSEPLGLRFLADQVEAFVSLGDLDRVSGTIAQLEERRRGLGGSWFDAAARRCTALVEAARGEQGPSVDGLDSMVDAHERLGEPFEVGRALLVAGSILRRAKEKRRARRSLERAAEIFDGLGAGPWTTKARAALARIGGRTPSRWELTESERRLASLVAAGKTNQEIAAALFITLNTVESTLRGVYRKLEVRSRTELAVRMAAERPADGKTEPR
jgi:DNA-binding CsgD family transcriptional regulator